MTEAGSVHAIAHVSTLLYPLNGTADGGRMDIRMDSNFPQYMAATNQGGIS